MSCASRCKDSQYMHIAVLIDQLRDEDAGTRCMAARELPKIADAIGDERTVHELIPFTRMYLVNDNNVSVVMSVAESLLKICDKPDYISTSEEYTNAFLYCLEDLCKVDCDKEEIRKTCLQGIIKLASNTVSHDFFMACFLPSLNRFVASDWSVCRILASRLCLAFMTIINTHYTHQDHGPVIAGEILNLYCNTLAFDENLSVRQACAICFFQLSTEAYAFQYIWNSTFRHKLGKCLDKFINCQKVPVVLALFSSLIRCDKGVDILTHAYSYSLSRVYRLLDSINSNTMLSRILIENYFDVWLQASNDFTDTDVDNIVHNFTRLIDNDECSGHVNNALLSLLRKPPTANRDIFIRKLKSCILARDPVCGTLLIKYLNVLGDADMMNFVIGIFKETDNQDLLLEMLEAMGDDNIRHDMKHNSRLRAAIVARIPVLSSSGNWRNRLRCMQCIVRVLICELYSINFLLDNCALFTPFFTDSVYTVREEACKLLHPIFEVCTNEEKDLVFKLLWKKISLLVVNENYLYRQIAYLALFHIFEKGYEQSVFNKTVMPVIAPVIQNEKVANVRLAAVFLLKNIGENDSLLGVLGNDKDQDVSYFAAH